MTPSKVNIVSITGITSPQQESPLMAEYILAKYVSAKVKSDHVFMFVFSLITIQCLCSG